MDFLKDFYHKYIHMTDKIFPMLSPSEQSVFNQLFARTIAEDRDTAPLSMKDFERLTNLTPNTIRKAIARLMAANLVSIAQEGKAHQAQHYRVSFPKQMADMQISAKLAKLQRNPVELAKIIGDIPEQGDTFSGILSRLSHEDRDLVERLRSSLTPNEEAELTAKARDLIKPGETVENKIRELIIARSFGRDRLQRYQAA